jgi:hypothetical protein
VGKLRKRNFQYAFIVSAYAAAFLLAGGCAAPKEADRGSLSAEKLFTAFYFSAAFNSGISENTAGIIDNNLGTVEIYLPFGVDRSSLTASFSFKGFSVTVDGAVQDSDVTGNDFSLPVEYIITAENGSTAEYIVTVQNQSLTPAAPIASAVTITGSPMIGAVLTGTYSYTDPNLDPEEGSERKWYRCDAPGLTEMSLCDEIISAGDTGTSSEPAAYTLAADDNEKYIYFQVIPVTTVEPFQGDAVLSSSTMQISNMNFSFEVVDGSNIPANWTPGASTLYSTDEGGASDGNRSAWLETLTTSYTDIESTYKYPLEHNDKVSLSIDYKTDIENQIRTQIRIRVYDSGDTVIATKEQTALVLDSTYLFWKTKSYSPTDKYYNAAYMKITIRVKHESAENTARLYFDNVKVTTIPDVPAAPTASSLTITGLAAEGQTLTGTYSYSDVNKDPEQGSERKWYRCGYSGLPVNEMTGDLCEEIAGSTDTGTAAVSPTYTLMNADVDKYVYFTVIPKNAVEPSAGAAAVSTASSQIQPPPEPEPPVASDVVITGTARVGSTLTGSYTYYDINGDAESGSIREWFRCSTSGLADMSGCGEAVIFGTGTASSSPVYTMVADDIGSYIYLRVTPKTTVEPITGTPVLSISIGPISNAPATDYIVISEVAIQYGASGDDEYIELYNPTDSPINLSENDYRIYRYTSGGTQTLVCSFNTPTHFINAYNVTIPAKSFYLIVNGAASNTDLLNMADAKTETNPSKRMTLTASNTVLLTKGGTPANGVLIDYVGYGSAGSYETVAAPEVAVNKSIERKAYYNSTSVTMSIGGSDEFKGNAYDSNDNSFDFILRDTPEPQNSLSTQEIP